MASNPKERIVAFIEGFAKASGLDLEVLPGEGGTDDEVMISLAGADARLFAGRGGQVLDALQLLALNILPDRQERRSGFHVTFDADGYRQRRREMLEKIAHETAEAVRRSKMEAVLDPMTPYERRIVHHALVGEPDVRTYSEGEEPKRYIVIAPAE